MPGYPDWLWSDVTGPTQVRAGLDPSLLPTDLSDAVILGPLYKDEGITAVLLADPLAAGRTAPDEQAALARATILWVASLLAPVLPITLQEQDVTGYRVQRMSVDLPALAAYLRQRAEACLAQVLDAGDETPYRPILFTTAPGQRGVIGYPGVVPLPPLMGTG